MRLNQLLGIQKNYLSINELKQKKIDILRKACLRFIVSRLFLDGRNNYGQLFGIDSLKFVKIEVLGTDSLNLKRITFKCIMYSKRRESMLHIERKLKTRNIYLNKLIAFLDKEPVKVITGIRRCGKSSLLKLMQEYLLDSGVE